MQVNVAGLRRNIKNLAHNYSDAQVKVREATSNDPWGPSAAIMAEIADLTYNVVAFSEIMQMIWKRLNDHGKNWRHVYKALILLEYLIKTGTEKVAQQCKENIFAIQTLREFVYFEENKDQGTHVREKAKQLVNLLKDDERLKNERIKALKAKERFAQHPSGFGSDGYVDGPQHRDMPPGWQQEEQKPISDLELVRPQTAGEEELQLKLAMAMSREEAEQEEAKRRSDDVRLQLALSQSEQDFKYEKDQTVRHHGKKEEPQSHLLDLLDISLGAASISSPPLGATGGVGGLDPWVTPARAASQLSDPWSGTSSPQIDPWQPTAAMRSNTSSVPLGAGAAGGGINGDSWALRTQSPSVASGSSTEGWLHSNGGAALNGNTAAASAAAAAASVGSSGGNNAIAADPWFGKSAISSLAAAQPSSSTLSGDPNIDPWITDTIKPIPATTTTTATTQSIIQAPLTIEDPWAPKALGNSDDPWKSLENAGTTKKPSPDLDEFDVISNRNKTGDLLTDDLLGGPNNNNATTEIVTTNGKKPLKTPQAFLGENSSLVNLDNLIKPVVPQTQPGNATYNPFSDTVLPPKTNLFQQQQPAVPSINQLKQQQPFAMSINQDPWAPISNPNAVAQQVKENPFLHESGGLETPDRYAPLIQISSTMDNTDESNSSNQANNPSHFYASSSFNNQINTVNNNSDSDDDYEPFNTPYVSYNYLTNQEYNNNNNNNKSNYDPYQSLRQHDKMSCSYHNFNNSFDTNNINNINSYNINKNNQNLNRFYPNACAETMNSCDAFNVPKNEIDASLMQSPSGLIDSTSLRGGSLFDYGFYDVNMITNNNNNNNMNNNINNSLQISSNLNNIYSNNNNNNNVGWMKPDAASSNPFLS